MILYSVTLPGRPYCKKTTMRVFGRGRNKRVVYSIPYQAWLQSAVLVLRQKLRPEVPINVPINLKAIFYFKDHSGEADLSALYEGIQDVLQSEGIIANDKLILGHNGSTKRFGEAPRIDVEISEFNVDTNNLSI